MSIRKAIGLRAKDDMRVKRRIILSLDQAWAFVFVRRGLYLRVPSVVVATACPVCGAKPGVPCMGRAGEEWTAVHFDRRRAART